MPTAERLNMPKPISPLAFVKILLGAALIQWGAQRLGFPFMGAVLLALGASDLAVWVTERRRNATR